MIFHPQFHKGDFARDPKKSIFDFHHDISSPYFSSNGLLLCSYLHARLAFCRLWPRCGRGKISQ